METLEQEARRCGVVEHLPSETKYTVTDHYRVSPDDTYCQCGEINFGDHDSGRVDAIHVTNYIPEF